MRKKDAIAKYRQALSAIATAHQKLYESRNAWSAKQLVTTLGPEIGQLTDAASSMKKAF
jgi:two-component sensor histidine kinase